MPRGAALQLAGATGLQPSGPLPAEVQLRRLEKLWAEQGTRAKLSKAQTSSEEVRGRERRIRSIQDVKITRFCKVLPGRAQT